MTTCRFCNSPCASLRLHWQTCDKYRRFMAGKTWNKAARSQCATPNCTNARAPKRLKCQICIDRELAMQVKSVAGNGWRKQHG